MSGLDKVCISYHCVWKHRCDLYHKSLPAGTRQYINPEQTADACHFFKQIHEPSWGEGAIDAND